MVQRNSQRTMVQDGGMEDLGNRIIEVAANPALTRQMEQPAFHGLRAQRSSFAKGQDICHDGWQW